MGWLKRSKAEPQEHIEPEAEVPETPAEQSGWQNASTDQFTLPAPKAALLGRMAERSGARLEQNQESVPLPDDWIKAAFAENAEPSAEAGPDTTDERNG